MAGNGELLNVPITFNGVSVGKEKVSVGVGIDHARVSREQMGELFVNRSLDIDLCTGDPDAQPLPGMDGDEVRIRGTVTAASYSEKKSSFGTRLSMPKGDAQPTDFWDLAGRSGWLRVNGSRVADANGDSSPLPGQRELPHPDVQPDVDRPRSGLTLAAAAELRKRPIPSGRGGFTKPQREILESAGIATLGALTDLCVKGDESVATVLQCGAPIAEAIVERWRGLGERAPEAAPADPPSEVSESVPDIDAAEEFDVPLEDGVKHEAWVTVAPLPSGWWSAGWEWSGDGGGARLDCESEGLLRQTKQAAIAAAAGQLVDSIERAESPESKAGQSRRSKAIAACKTFYSEAERGGVTIFDAAGN